MVKWGQRMKRYVTISPPIAIHTQVVFSKSSEGESSSEEEEEKPKLHFRPRFVPKCACITRIPPVCS